MFIFAFDFLFLRLIIYFCVCLFAFAFGCMFLHPYEYTKKHTANRVNSWRLIFLSRKNSAYFLNAPRTSRNAHATHKNNAKHAHERAHTILLC